MKFSATLEVHCKKPQQLFGAILPDIENQKKDRSGVKIKAGNGKVVFYIESRDAVALRAACDSLIKLLIVFEKMQKI